LIYSVDDGMGPVQAAIDNNSYFAAIGGPDSLPTRLVFAARGHDNSRPLTEDEVVAKLFTLFCKVQPTVWRLAALKGVVMALIARVFGVALITSALVAGLLLALLQPDRHSTDILGIFFLACVGGIIGAIAGAAREIVSAQRQKASNWSDTK
jgi:hypothetical protein